MVPESQSRRATERAREIAQCGLPRLTSRLLTGVSGVGHASKEKDRRWHTDHSVSAQCAVVGCWGPCFTVSRSAPLSIRPLLSPQTLSRLGQSPVAVSCRCLQQYTLWRGESGCAVTAAPRSTLRAACARQTSFPACLRLRLRELDHLQHIHVPIWHRACSSPHLA